MVLRLSALSMSSLDIAQRSPINVDIVNYLDCHEKKLLPLRRTIQISGLQDSFLLKLLENTFCKSLVKCLTQNLKIQKFQK